MPPASKVFPTRVGVFLSFVFYMIYRQSFPHASGGVSNAAQEAILQWAFSPREWGCFHQESVESIYQKVFPTRVGVFPLPQIWRPGQIGFPHASGGVSEKRSF